MAWAKKLALMIAPRTATIHNAAKTGYRFNRNGSTLYKVPNIPDPHNATCNPGVLYVACPYMPIYNDVTNASRHVTMASRGFNNPAAMGNCGLLIRSISTSVI